MTTIPQFLEESSRRFPEKTALQIKKGGRYHRVSYWDLHDRVEKVASGLHSLGMEKGDRVGILSENRPEWAMAYLGILKGGGVAIPLDPQLKPGELRAIFEIAKVKFCFSSSLFLLLLAEVSKDLPFFQRLLSLEEELPAGVFSLSLSEAETLSLFQLPQPSSPRNISVDEKDLAILIFTSGTTGNSKGVMLSHRNIVSNVKSLRDAVYFDERDNFLSVLPLHHAFEATCGFLVPLSQGASITYARSLKSRDILEGISETGVTVMLGVPLLYEKMLEGIFRGVKEKTLLVRSLFKILWGVSKGIKGVLGLNAGRVLFRGLRKRAGLSPLRLMVCGGAPLSPEVGGGFETFGIPFLQGYGLSESSPVLTLNPLHKVKMESIGKPIPGVEVKIDCPDEKGVGEIIARGQNIMVGYYEDTVRTRETLREGWLFTGDLGWQDKEGYFYIAGRSKNVIVTKAGKNVYPEEVEGELLKSLYIAEVMVYGKQNPETKREEVHAMVYPHYENLKGSNIKNEEVFRILDEEIKKHCDNLADYKRVKEFEIRTEEFPKTTTRKIKRFMVGKGSS